MLLFWVFEMAMEVAVAYIEMEVYSVLMLFFAFFLFDVVTFTGGGDVPDAALAGCT